MKKVQIPVFNIDDFGHEHQSDFYANTIPLHLKYHHFVNTPHKHDFYLTMIFTKGSGTHEIDFKTYEVKPGSVFVMFPGQTHSWKLSEGVDGFIFFHSREFFDLHFNTIKISDYPFFQSTESSSLFRFKAKATAELTNVFELILNEYTNNKPLRDHKLRALINSLYIELYRTRESSGGEPASLLYLTKLKEFEGLIEKHFRETKLAGEYAEMMNVSERHLNRICKQCLNKTATEIILDRIVLEAKRMLVNTEMSVTQIADKLGYEDNSYFSRIFRKRTGETPKTFLKRSKAAH